MIVVLTFRCRCGCGSVEHTSHHWADAMPVSWVAEFARQFYPDAAYELRPADGMLEVDRLVREKTVRVVLEEQAREALR